MLLCLSQGDNVRARRALRIDHHNHLTLEHAETDLPRFTIFLANVLTRHSEVVPYCIASGEVQAMLFYIDLRLDSSHVTIVLQLQNTGRVGKNELRDGQASLT
jgi:hypothetical protein